MLCLGRMLQAGQVLFAGWVVGWLAGYEKRKVVEQAARKKIKVKPPGFHTRRPPLKQIPPSTRRTRHRKAEL